MEKYYSFVLRELRHYLDSTSVSDVIVGLSGGIDSALVTAMATDAFGSSHVQTVMMPSPYTSQESIEDAAEVAKNLGVNHIIIPITKLIESFKEVFSNFMQWESQDLTEQNLQARIRAVILMGLSNKTNGIVLATSNKSEILTGYFTIYGDSCGGYAPISAFLKTQVYKLAQWRNKNIPRESCLSKKHIIPEKVLAKPPTAELKHHQKDSDELPEYAILDRILTSILSDKDPMTLGLEEQIVLKAIDRIKNFEYKRRYLPVGPDISQID